MVAPIPPELMGLPPMPPPMPLGAPPALGPGTPAPPPLGSPQQVAGTVLGQLNPLGAAPAPPPSDLFGDPTLSALAGSGQLPPFDPYAGLPDTQKPGYMPYLEPGIWREVASADRDYWRRTIRRFSRDLMLYRQRYSAKPPGFDPKRELAFRSAQLSNVVNKLTNMASQLDFRYEVPFKDEETRKASQILENWQGYLRRCEEIEYAASGGHASLQWDEFFYAHLYGRLAGRILPRPDRPDHPFDEELLDPATLYPVWGGGTEGLVRITHRRMMTAIDVIASYTEHAPNLDQRIKEFMRAHHGADSNEYRTYYHQERELIECWDTWRKITFWGDFVVEEGEHKLGYVPFVYVTAKGEPRGLTTPEGHYWVSPLDSEDDDSGDEVVTVTAGEDQAEKGISVFHHAINTNRLTEIVYSLLTTEIYKAARPATITYGAPQTSGLRMQPLDFRPGGSNWRILNAQRVELAPTSPRPSDISPVLGKLTGEMVEGTLNPASYGNIEGSNIAGFAIEAMTAAAKDTVLPYLRCWEIFQAQKASLRTRLYQDRILAIAPMAAPMDGRYGKKASEEVTAEVLGQAGTKFTVEIIGVSDQQLPMLVNAAGGAVERGFWSRRKAMEKLGEKDPQRMIQEIIIERALEHPEMMENFLIPITFIRAGQKDLADLWVLMVVMPKVQQLMGQMLGGGAGGAMAGLMAAGGGGAPPGGAPMLGPGAGPPPMLGPGGPEQNGQSNPMAGRARGAPTGPLPGQGRGPAPAGLMAGMMG